MNKAVIIGRIVRDPELRFTPNKGTAIANITVAVDNGYDENKKTDFIPVVLYGKQAENTAQYLTKGSLVAVSGRISTRNYEAKDGTKRYVTEVIADSYGGIKFLNSKKIAAIGSSDNTFGTEEPIFDEDSPF